MKKIFVILIVFLSCFSLMAVDIPIDWTLQIFNVLEEDFSEYEIEKIDPKTIKITYRYDLKIGEHDFGFYEIYSYYFRFNLTPEEELADKKIIINKVPEVFLEGRDVRLFENPIKDCLYISMSLNESESLMFFYDLGEDFPSLTHYFVHTVHCR